MQLGPGRHHVARGQAVRGAHNAARLRARPRGRACFVRGAIMRCQPLLPQEAGGRDIGGLDHRLLDMQDRTEER